MHAYMLPDADDFVVATAAIVGVATGDANADADNAWSNGVVSAWFY